MEYIILHITIASALTIDGIVLICLVFALQVKKSIVSARGVLPVGQKKGIITLTLVISRESIKPGVTPGFYVMKFHIFRVKTKLESQLEEYLVWKAKFSQYAADRHREVLIPFIKRLNYKDISEILISDIEGFYNDTKTQYQNSQAKMAIKGLMGYFKTKKQHNIDPKQIEKATFTQLPSVVKNANISNMNKRRPGRPLENVELIKKVKRLRDKEHIPFRKIGLALGKDVGHVYRMYRYDFNKTLTER